SSGPQRIIPLNPDGTFFINWSLQWNDERMALASFEEVVEGRSDVAWRDKLVVVGSIGSGNNISDIGATPVSNSTYLVSKHWNIANSILMSQFIQRSALGTTLLLIILFGLLGAVLTLQERVLPSTAMLLAVVAIYVFGAWFLFVEARYWLPMVLPLGTLVASHGCLVTHRLVFEQSEKHRIKAVFSKIVSPAVVNELLSVEKLSLGGARREITIFFADIRGFTEMTDAAQARAEEYVKKNALSKEEAEQFFDAVASDTLATVNLYLATIADIVKKYNGTLDKYIGDCVMAFWGAPTENNQHALGAVRAAVEAQRAIYRLNQERFAENERRKKLNEARQAEGKAPLEPLALLTLGTGINSGTAIVGLMGSDDHVFNYTVFGREVNLASRLETLSGRGRVIIGEGTYQALLRDDPQLAATCIPQPAVAVKGIRGNLCVYEVPWKIVSTEPVPTPLPTSLPTDKVQT
ncbi:MAG: adenylate/guanylate cyclase domain-containing protein, partial [Limisphaerales bacterium]